MVYYNSTNESDLGRTINIYKPKIIFVKKTRNKIIPFYLNTIERE